VLVQAAKHFGITVAHHNDAQRQPQNQQA
jgi:hypothetical protein